MKSQIQNIVGTSANKTRKRVGRGSSAGGGKTAGRGTKGQKARTGGQVPQYFEGGQTPIIRRLKKQKGFKSRNRVKTLGINLSDLQRLSKDGKLEVATLIEAGHIKPGTRVKILARGEVTAAIAVSAHAVSAAAKEKITHAGGSVNLI